MIGLDYPCTVRRHFKCHHRKMILYFFFILMWWPKKFATYNNDDNNDGNNNDIVAVACKPCIIFDSHSWVDWGFTWWWSYIASCCENLSSSSLNFLLLFCSGLPDWLCLASVCSIAYVLCFICCRLESSLKHIQSLSLSLPPQIVIIP